ncbi:hypothetical protein Cgig2_008638 [Carnegiea gigantea]|uniref:Protein FAR1-RELATED SEQUENCE n=1 Tax=Carnegiea gigantea TaxID=171969 RepID=A0A9Q1JWG8_9CARY|nr:hypothetical protein Cgig2_008638 [Carnegiea gigantea]
MTSKFSGWFTSILRNRYPDWCSEFYKLYKLETIEEFESQWDVIVLAYLRNYFFGGMTTIGRSEYINGFIKRFISSNTTLKDLVKWFKEECSKSIQYLILYTSGNNFILRYYEGSHNRNHQVNLNFLEYCHILQIFIHNDSHKITSTYLPSRWCPQHHNHELDVLEGQILIDSDPLMAGNDILCPPKSTTKGRTRKKQMKGGKECIKHSRHY